MAILIALLAPVLLANVHAANPEITGFSITPDKSAYYIGQTVQALIKFDYKNFATSTPLKVEIYNSSNKLIQTITGISVSGNGTYSQTHTLSAISTSKTGTFSFTGKLIDNSTGYVLATAAFSIIVSERQILLTVAWQDASSDRKIDVAEDVTFTVYITWSFVNQTISASLYVIVDSGTELLLSSVSLTQGSGSTSKQYQTSFASEGKHTVKFELRDANDTVLASKTVSVTVGEPKASILDVIANHSVVIFAAIALILVVLYIFKRG